MTEPRESSRFADFSPLRARLILLACLMLIVAGLGIGRAQPAPAAGAEAGAVGEAAHADVELYKRITDGVRRGGDYHPVAARAQRESGYPLKPFVTMRPPTLAWLQAGLGDKASAALLYLLIAGAAGAWMLRLKREGAGTGRALAGASLLLIGCLVFVRPELLHWHEAWAAPLIAMSLALSGPRFPAAIAAGLAAALIREIAVLNLLAMFGAACFEKRLREAAAWGGALLAFAVFMAWHAAEVLQVTLADDLASPGWAVAGGWSFVVEMLHLTGPLRALPSQVTAVLLPLALLGWAGWRTSLGGRAALLLAAYVAVFSLVGRPDNYYWGFLIAPLLPLGLIFVPTAARDLLSAARGASRS